VRLWAIEHRRERKVNQPSTETASKHTSRGIWPLLSLNFFMADMQAGIGPFLGVFLLAHGWKSGLIGTVMTVGGVAGMLMTTPAGALVDATRRKKLYVVIPGICTVIASGIVLLSQSFWLVTLSQVATAIAGAAIGPAVSGMTLGIVRQAGFNRQNGRNQALNHAGNMVGAGLSACSDGGSAFRPCWCWPRYSAFFRLFRS
jgi:predicted MFS family arabinose efflux permease